MGGASGAEPSVTVIIPAYNAQDYLARALACAKAQTHPNFEILIVNDGSTDATGEIAARAAKKDARIRVVSTPNRGVAEARNRGIAESTTDYVAFLDADDLWHPTKIARQLAALAEHEGDPEWAACYALYRIIDADDRVIADGRADVARGAFFAEHLVVNHVNNGSSLLVRRDAALAVGGFSDPFYAEHGKGGCEDLDFQLRILSRYKMEAVGEYLVGYRKIPGSMSDDHLVMARGLLGLVERFIDSPLLTPEDRAVARFNANAHAALRLAKAGEWGRFARTLAIMVPQDARGTALFFSRGVWRVISTKMLGRGPARKPLRRFADYTPTEGLPRA